MEDFQYDKKRDTLFPEDDDAERISISVGPVAGEVVKADLPPEVPGKDELPKAEPLPEKLPQPAERPQRLHVPESGSDGKPALGLFLKSLREQHGYSLKQIAEETKIRELYLDALEKEDYNTLPPLAYILGYVRRLCEIYRVEPQKIDELTADLREELRKECAVPEELIGKSIVDREISEENRKKLRQIIFVLCGGGILIFAVLTCAILLLLGGMRSRTPAPAVPEKPEIRQKAPEGTGANVKDDIRGMIPKGKWNVSVLPR